MNRDIWNRAKNLTLFLILFVIALVVLLLIGAMIGYGILGQGNPFHVLTPSFWSNLFQLI